MRQVYRPSDVLLTWMGIDRLLIVRRGEKEIRSIYRARKHEKRLIGEIQQEGF